MTRKDLDLKYFEQKLLTEKERLIGELKTLGRINPDNPLDWEATAGEQEENNTSDKNDFADSIEEFEENTAILKELETELVEVNAALKRIGEGTYGICEKTGKEISKERLEAYPAARTIVEK
jgi:RNA polymerase-binding transcription factor DksA